ncbi:hypothetical protein B7R22_18280 [Subtercola boreus]|uniref:KAP NTPase domain-containing protein n=1 Tax=Subtercola boreus TaxID=120213 RepID=A0A3E0VQ89_9MICO|nr:P-loop NTPase fold protein [Subtercola boreus]RFA11700.1 hypothetical protein B7R22_18280 [Subtercola boreus]
MVPNHTIKWGSKPQILNMIRGELTTPEWVIADFSPWSAMDAASLTSEFLNTLASAFGDDDGGKGVRDAILSYSRVALPFLGLLGPIGSAAQSAANVGIEFLKERPLPWNVAFQDLADKIAERNQRVLIVADDIDRLDPAELMALLRVIRLLGRFDNVHYLLAYDQDTIESILAHQGFTGRTTSFMEKIVQYPFEVPPMASVDKRRLLNTTVRALLERADKSSIRMSAEQVETREQRALDLMSILLDGLSTPRSFARFQEQVNSYAGLVSFDEIDVLDFIAVTYLRVFHHPLWATLPQWRDELTRGKKFEDETDATGKRWEARIKEFADERNAQTAIIMIGFLVQDVPTNLRSSFVAHVNGFSDPKYFERYFIAQLADDDVSDVLVAQAVDELIAGEAMRPRAGELAAVIDDVGNPDRAMLAIEKVIGRRGSESRSSAAAIEYVQERLNAQPLGGASFDRPRGLLSRWAAREMLSGLEDDLLDARSAIDSFGEDGAFGYLYQLNGSAQTRQAVKKQAPKFVDYVVDAITDHLEEVLLDRRRLRTFFDLAVFADARDRVAGLLDVQVEGNLELFADCVASFGTVNEWVGSGYHYEITFSQDLYVIAFGDRIRAELAPRLTPSRSRDEIEHDELAEYPPDEDIRDFALDYAKRLAAEAAVETQRAQDQAD